MLYDCSLLVTQLVQYKRRALRYQRGNQNRSIEEGQTKQWPKERAQKDK